MDRWIKLKQSNAPSQPLEASHLDSLRAFRGHNRLKKAALHAIARRMNEEDIRQLKDVFKSLDKNNDGVVTFHEVKAGIDQIAGSPDIVNDIEEMMKEWDVNENMTLDYTEFIAATLNDRVYQEETMLWAAF